jgi:eukaryotic-like serine/threonine-protein kinase
MRLQLGRDWTIGARIGGGGFGQVYAASSSDYEFAVAKMVPKAPGAERELLFVDLDGVRNIVPMIDSGETPESWVLIMPRAEKSLRQHLDDVAGPVGISDAVAALSAVASALVDLDGRIVHRDLKPENILLLDGTWCLADFGISRYAEATTAPDTQKHALSAPYAAPERWRAERATAATDVYSLGVIAYELLSGSRPFAGPAMHDFREQHLHSNPAPLVNVPVALGALIEECLYKAAEARPTPANVLARLASVEKSALSAGVAKLQEASRAEVARRAERARQDSRDRSEAERRAALVDAASIGLRRIGETLRLEITQAAPAASVRQVQGGGWHVRLDTAGLEFGAARPTSPSPWGARRPPAFDVLAHAAMSLRVPPDREEYDGRSHSLWYCDAEEAGSYQWFETAFMISALVAGRGRQNPFAMDPGEEAATALGASLGRFQVAWPFTPLTPGDLDEFTDRWAGWFAEAAQGQLRHPPRMPERPPQNTWRR